VLSLILKKITKNKNLKKRRLRRDERNIVVNKRVSENENFTHTVSTHGEQKKTNKRDFVKWLE